MRVRHQFSVELPPAGDAAAAKRILGTFAEAAAVAKVLRCVITVHWLRRLCRSCAEPIGRTRARARRSLAACALANLTFVFGCAEEAVEESLRDGRGDVGGELLDGRHVDHSHAGRVEFCSGIGVLEHEIALFGGRDDVDDFLFRIDGDPEHTQVTLAHARAARGDVAAGVVHGLHPVAVGEVGELQEGGGMRQIYEGLGLGDDDAGGFR